MEIRWHDAKTDKPKKPGDFLTASVLENGEVYYMSNIHYSAEHDGWNVYHDNQDEMDVDFWTDIPRVAEIKNDIEMN